MDIWTADSRPSKTASPDYFTGHVRQTPVVEAPAPARLRALSVTFEPGARTNWHTHPLGQTIHITAGHGLVCTRGGTPRRVGVGDTVFFAPGEEHWHGAAPDSAMTHIAMQEAQDGRVADWLEPVSDADYGAAPD